MVLKDVKYDATNKDTAISRTMGTTQVIKDSLGKDYGVWNLEFSTQGLIIILLTFMKDLENNLRVADISSIQFSSNASMGLNPSLSEAYRYRF